MDGMNRMSQKSRFKVGDRVKLITYAHGESSSNPVWGGRFGKIEGKVTAAGNYGEDQIFNLEVDWPNGLGNSYRERDLDFVKQKEWDE